MTSEELEGALEFLRDAIKTLADPRVMARLKYLQAEADGTVWWANQFTPVEGEERAAKRGKCPTCGKSCSLNSDDTIRRHTDTKYGKERCHIDKQLPAEIIPAILLISQLGEVAEDAGNNDGRTQ